MPFTTGLYLPPRGPKPAEEPHFQSLYRTTYKEPKTQPVPDRPPVYPVRQHKLAKGTATFKEMAEGTPFGTRFTDSPYKGRLFKTSTEPLCDFVFGDGPVATKSHRGKLFTQKTSCITHISPTRHTNRLTWEDPNSPQSWTSSQRSPGGSPGFRTSSDNEALKTRYSTDKCFKPAAGVTYI